MKVPNLKPPLLLLQAQRLGPDDCTKEDLVRLLFEEDRRDSVIPVYYIVMFYNHHHLCYVLAARRAAVMMMSSCAICAICKLLDEIQRSHPTEGCSQWKVEALSSPCGYVAYQILLGEVWWELFNRWVRTHWLGGYNTSTSKDDYVGFKGSSLPMYTVHANSFVLGIKIKYLGYKMLRPKCL